MASSPHSSGQRNDMQSRYTAAQTTLTAALAAGQNTVAAAMAATRQDLQLVVTRELGAPLS